LHSDAIYFDTRFVIDNLRIDTGAPDTELPEPSAMLLFGSGLLLLLLAAQRRTGRLSGAKSGGRD
jgi:hypothetical protein